MKHIKSFRIFFAVLFLLLSVFCDRNSQAQEQAQKKQVIIFAPAKRDPKQIKLQEIIATEQEKEAKLKKAADEKARKEEEKRLEAEAQAQARELEGALKEAQARARQEELARQQEARQEELAKAREQREVELKTKEEERVRLKEELARQKQARQEELARQKEARQEELAKVREQREAELHACREELARRKREHLEEAARIKEEKEAEARARQEELARQQEARQEELARQKEERLKEAARAKEIKEAQARARQEELARQQEARQEELAKAREQREVELKAKEEERVRLKEELARQKQARQEELAEAKEQKEAQARARQEELARKKEERLKEEAKKREQIAKAKEQREAELKAKEEEKVRLEAESRAREAELKVQREREAEEEQFRLEEEKRAREEELAWEREQKSEELARQKEERMEELARAKEERQAQLRSRQEEKAQEEQERLEDLIWQREQREIELSARQEELARLEAERKLREADLEAQQEEVKQKEFRARQGELAKKIEESKAKVSEAKKATEQEKVITEAMLKKQKEDQAKIDKIEKLWKRAKKLYDQERFQEAIQDFEKIVELEGNPRIKYTPEAKELIEKAKARIEEKKGALLSSKVELSDKEMINEVIKQQVPPYLDLPKRLEEKEAAFLIEPPAIRKKLKATKVTMDFDKVGLKSALAFLAQESGINFIASQKVLELTPVVSARFKDTALDEVIKYITKNLGLIYRVDKEVVWIAHPEEVSNEAMETRVYYLNKGGGLFTEFSPMSSGTTETGLGGSSAQINKVYTIEDTLKEVILWPSDSKLSYDKRLNALIVRNTPQNLQMLEDILYNMDIEPIQILIEARFIEVDVTNTKELGLEWKFANGDFQLKDREGNFKAGIGKDSGVDFSNFSRGTEGLNFTYKGMLTNSQFQAVLHALEESRKIKTLSSPRITTLNNQPATLKVVEEWIYPTRYEYEIVQVDLNQDGDFVDVGETTYKNVPKDFLRRDVGLILKVIPAVGSDKKTISLSLIPEVSEAVADGFIYTGDVRLPKFTSRNLSTSVVVSSGDTVVLGGMITESRTKTLTKVPFLGDVPFLGSFFKKNTDSVQRKNLLIFVTAKILSSSGEEVIVAGK